MPNATQKAKPRKGKKKYLEIPVFGFQRKRRAEQVATFLIELGCFPRALFSIDYRIDRLIAAPDCLDSLDGARTFYMRVINWRPDTIRAEWTTEPALLHRKLKSRADQALIDHTTVTPSRQPMTIRVPLETHAN